VQEQHKKQPEISIIVPVYKTERFLSACISSILAQTFTNFELILVDDGSPDSCPALCDAAAAKDSRIRVIHQKNRGLSVARNAGLDAAKLYHAAQEAGAQMAVCNYRQVDEALTPIRKQYLHVRREVLTPEQALEHSTLLPYMVVWNKLYHRSIFAQLRFAEGKLNEDTLLIAYAYEKADRIANIPDALYLYRKVAGSIVNSKVTLRNLDRVEANYTVFECVRRHGITGSLCELYWALLHSLIDVGMHLTAEERRSARMQQAREYERCARRALRQEHAVTLRALGNTLCFIISQDWYFARRWKNTV
jgi:glycosyltransferase involved in cell wall biosynthesis